MNKNVPAALLIEERFSSNLIGHGLNHYAHHDNYADFSSARVPSLMHAVPNAQVDTMMCSPSSSF
jgi:hypothetical protein